MSADDCFNSNNNNNNNNNNIITVIIILVYCTSDEKFLNHVFDLAFFSIFPRKYYLWFPIVNIIKIVIIIK